MKFPIKSNIKAVIKNSSQEYPVLYILTLKLKNFISVNWKGFLYFHNVMSFETLSHKFVSIISWCIVIVTFTGRYQWPIQLDNVFIVYYYNSLQCSMVYLRQRWLARIIFTFFTHSVMYLKYSIFSLILGFFWSQ